MRVIAREPQLRQFALERRAELEHVAWRALLDRGVSAHDLGVRVAVGIVVGLGYHALVMWAESDDAEALPSVLARYLLSVPAPGRLAAGLFPDAQPSEKAR